MRYQSGSERRAAAKVRCWSRSACAALASAYTVSAETVSFFDTVVVFLREGFGLLDAAVDFFLGAAAFLVVVDEELFLLLLFEALVVGAGLAAAVVVLATAAADVDDPTDGAVGAAALPVLLGAPELDMLILVPKWL